MPEERYANAPRASDARGRASGSAAAQLAARVAPVQESDLAELLELLRGYCDFYGVAPSDDALQKLSRSLIADPRREGVQLLAREHGGRAAGFATLFWSWSTARAARIGVMNDLYVQPACRGRRIGELLIAACVERCRAHAAAAVEWQTAPGNSSAQALYQRVGATREDWLSYSLELDPQGAPAARPEG